MRFYEEQDIPLDKTDMGFAIDLPYIAWSFKSGLANVWRLLRHPRFWQFVRDKNRFHQDARVFLAAADPDNPERMTLAEFCQRQGYGDGFVKGWLEPFCEAVWSTPKAEALAMEAHAILSFLRNHGFLNWTHVQWYTPKGRTLVTLKRFAELFAKYGVQARVNTDVQQITRLPGGKVRIGWRDVTAGSTLLQEDFDHVVLAAPAGVALKVCGVEGGLPRHLGAKLNADRLMFFPHLSYCRTPRLKIATVWKDFVAAPIESCCTPIRG